ncbi:unnamed protein product [Dicrocoelium dendriticum]|nr:unnamed protein product [Dicrocoelium dendriticum]
MASCCRLLECAFGSKPCFIPCARNTRESTASRLMYSIILLLTVLLSLASHDGGLMGIIFDEYKEQILSICDDINGGPNCMRFRGFVGIYRLCLPLFAFHFTMTFVTIKVSSSQTFRGRIHNGFWLWKICFLLFMYIMAYTFPFLEDYTKIWMVLGIFGALIFIYIQHITLIDFSYEVNEIWYAKSFQTRWFTFSIYLCSVLLYIGTAAAYSLLLLFYGLPHGCSLNLTLTGINFGLTTLSAICSVFSDPLRRRHLWLPGAVTSAFVAFLTWSALSSQPKTISSDVPWHGFPSRPRNITVHPILVVADQLNRLLSDTSFTRKPSVTSNLPTLRRNDCVPGGISSTGEHLGKDLITVCTLVLVIGGSVYSSFRASMEARRLGIRTRREKIKRLLAAIPEQRELDFQTSPIRLPVSKKGKDISGPLPPPFFDHKEVVRQEEGER